MIFSIGPYLRLSRLHNGIWLFNFSFWPCALGLSMAAYHNDMPPLEFAKMTAAFLTGSVFFHAGICTYNDICDVEIDRKVERTKNRPLAANEISIPAATVWLIIQISVAFGFLYLSNSLAFNTGIVSMFPLHLVYPLLKRYSNWPAGWLGIAFGWGLLVGWISVVGDLVDMRIPLSLLVASACWTMVYETIYQCQDMREDRVAGLKSTALLFGNSIRPILFVFACVSIVAMLYAGLENRNGWAYQIVAVGIYGLALLRMVSKFDPGNPSNCLSTFRDNRKLGWIMWGGVLLDYIIKIA